MAFRARFAACQSVCCPEVEKGWGEKEETAPASNPRTMQVLDPVNWAREGSALPKVMDSRLRVTARSFAPGLRVSYRPWGLPSSLTDRTQGCHFLSGFTSARAKEQTPFDEEWVCLPG